MSTPVRIQLSRKKGFVLQFESQAINGLPAIKVDRSTKWGNPWEVWKDDDGQWFCTYDGRSHHPVDDKVSGLILAISNFQTAMEKRVGVFGHSTDMLELRGKNLACWCPADSPCHADVLLEFANRALS